MKNINDTPADQVLKITPLKDWILIKPVASEEKTAGGLYIPTVAQEQSQKAEVIAAGKGRYTEAGNFIATAVKPGDIVIVSKYPGTEVFLNGEKYLMIKEEEIHGVFI